MRSFKPPYNFLEGALLLVDKPLEWTSFDVVNKIRYALKKHLDIKKIKVGHAGTLDPLATGLLLICTGKFTKIIDQLQVKDKCYEGTIQLGASTPSYDAETEIDQRYPIEHINQALVDQVKEQFVGEIKQVPPMFSAIKKDGKKLYQLARKGKTIQVEPRSIKIHELELKLKSSDQVEFKVSCSKGTYIRSLAFDLGKAMNSGAYLSNLTRTSIGDYPLKDAWKLADFLEHLQTIDQPTGQPR